MFTLTFDGYINTKSANPLTAETPFGVAVIAGIGNVFEDADVYREALEEIADGISGRDAGEIARQALDARNEAVRAEIEAGRAARAQP